jgi:PilZ domain-containing protein
MKVLDPTKSPSGDTVPVVEATPVPSRRPEPTQPVVVPVRPAFSGAESTVTFFLRQFRVLLGAARLYQRDHPRLIEILSSTEQQLRIALTTRSPLVLAVDTKGMMLPRHEGGMVELLHDQRGELKALAEDFLRSGITSLLFTHPINVGELDLFAHEISQVPRTVSPGDTASRRLWDSWIRERGIVGIRVNIPTERRDSLLLASLTSTVMAYDHETQKPARGSRTMPQANFEQITAALRLLAKLTPSSDPDAQSSTQDLARGFHALVSGSEPSSIALLVYGVSNFRARDGESLISYVERLTDELVLAYVGQEFSAGRTRAPELVPLFVRLDQERGHADLNGNAPFGGSQHDEVRVSMLCERFWNALPARVTGKILRSGDAWCVPPPVVTRFLEPLTAAAEKKKSDAAAREGRAVLMSYTRCLESEENKARRAVAAGLSEIAPQLERLWPHASMADFGRGVVQALLVETSPGIAGLLSAVVEKLARAALVKHEYGEFEKILETLESAPRDDEHAHIATLVGRVMNDDQWLYLVDEALSGQALNAVLPRLLRRSPDRLIDRLGLLLTAPRGLDSLPAMVRLIHGSGEPVLGALETRLYEARRQRTLTAIHLLASSDPKRLAAALPRALASWEWSLQDLAATELIKWTNPPVVAATAKAFLATLPEAHALVVPCMIDHLGMAHETDAAPLLLDVAEGRHITLRDIYFRIKAVEALGRMHVGEAVPTLMRIVRERNGLAHGEPAALRSAAEEALSILENKPAAARVKNAEGAEAKPNTTHGRPRRYARARLVPALPATITGGRGGAARVRVIALGGALLETDQRLAIGDSMHLEIRVGLRKLQSTAVVRNVTPSGAGVEFVHMKPQDRERLRRLVVQELK